jgi:2-dehydro-3-deoxyphosphogluconate aldolase/(4S)-4-hydroxy-2-oxoglutarate aldolase
VASTTADPFVERLARERLIAILRAPDADRFVAAASVLYDAGWRGIEVTLTTEGALDAIGAIREALPDDAWVGAGTVMSPADVQAVHAAGAQFAVSPVLDDGSVAAASRLGLPFVPGALTPSEIVTAWRAGCPAVKVSPVVSVGGPGYLAQVGAFLPGIPMLPTGGVRPADVPAYLQAGALGVGLSGPLLGDALAPAGDLAALARRAAEAVAAVPAALSPAALSPVVGGAGAAR